MTSPGASVGALELNAQAPYVLRMWLDWAEPADVLSSSSRVFSTLRYPVSLTSIRAMLPKVGAWPCRILRG